SPSISGSATRSTCPTTSCRRSCPRIYSRAEPVDHLGARQESDARQGRDAHTAQSAPSALTHDIDEHALRHTDEHALRHMIRDVQTGRLSRRRFVRALVGLGLTAPIAAQLLGPGTARAQTPAGAPARRGGGGALRLLYWQAPTILNPHLTVGVKDVAASRIF